MRNRRKPSGSCFVGHPVLSPRDALLRDQLPTLGGGGGNWSV